MRTARRCAVVFLAVGFALAASAPAATIVHTEARHSNGRYTLLFEVVLDAERGKIWPWMTDYERLPRLSDVVVASRIVQSEADNKHRVHVTFHACILIFCKTMKKLVDIQVWPQSDIIVVGDPRLSDFSYSVERWRVSAEKSQTRLNYHAEMVPNFFIPPLFGPWLVKTFLQREIRATAAKLEALANQ